MMQHVKALLLSLLDHKFLYLYHFGLMFEMTFCEVFLLTAVLGIVAYLIGDMLVLPRTINTAATVVDFVLAGAIIYWFYDGMTLADNGFTSSLTDAIVVGLFETFFHRYVGNNVLPSDRCNRYLRNLQ